MKHKANTKLPNKNKNKAQDTMHPSTPFTSINEKSAMRQAGKTMHMQVQLWLAKLYY